MDRIYLSSKRSRRKQKEKFEKRHAELEKEAFEELVGEPKAKCVAILMYRNNFENAKKACKQLNKTIKKAKKTGGEELRNAQKACLYHEETITKDQFVKARFRTEPLETKKLRVCELDTRGFWSID